MRVPIGRPVFETTLEIITLRCLIKVTVVLFTRDEEMTHTHSGVRDPVQGVRVDVIANSFIALQVSLEPPHIET